MIGWIITGQKKMLEKNALWNFYQMSIRINFDRGSLGILLGIGENSIYDFLIVEV